MSLYRFKLYLSMITTLAIFIAISTLAIILVTDFFGLNLYIGLAIALVFNLIQWITAPKIIEAVYKVRPLSYREAPEIHDIVSKLSSKLGIKKPEVMLAEVDIPNAFAYGSIFGKKKVAITRGLLYTLNLDEIEAVLGHELGHIKHRDVQALMFMSVLPSVFYIISRIALYQLYFSPFIESSDEENPATVAAAIGFISLIIYFILQLILLAFSRLREYYADYESACNVDNGARKLMAALARITYSTSRIIRRGDLGSIGAFKALLIADPDVALKDIGLIASFRNDYKLAAFFRYILL